MSVSRLRVAMFSAMLLPAIARADLSQGLVSGVASDGTPVGASVETEFIPTGGDFDAGQGTGLLRIRLVNLSGAVTYATPKRGNAVATEVRFNLSPRAHAFLLRATLPATSLLCQMGSPSYPTLAPTSVLGAPMDVSALYELRANPIPAGFGSYTHTIASVGGTRGGLVDSQLFQGLNRRGDVYSALVFGGAIEFELWVSGLDRSQDSAVDFVAGCALSSRGTVPGAVAVRYQGIGVGGELSAVAANLCATTPVVPSTWGAIKSLYR